MIIAITAMLSRSVNRKLRDMGEIITWRVNPNDLPEEEEYIKWCLDANIIIVEYMPITKKIINKLENLKLIVSVASTPEKIDVEAATKKKIPVLYAAGSSSRSVAEYTVGLILSLLYNIPYGMNYVHHKKWKSPYVPSLHNNATELYGKTVGIIGLSFTGRRVAYLLKGFDTRILVFDIFSKDFSFPGVTLTSLDDLLKDSDIISLHAGISQDNPPVIGYREFCLMLKKPYFINTSFSESVEEEDLCLALKEKRIKGAALDVFSTETLPRDHFLFKMKNVILTPRIAASAREVITLRSEIVYKDILLYMSKKRPFNCFNPEVFPDD